MHLMPRESHGAVDLPFAESSRIQFVPQQELTGTSTIPEPFVVLL